MEDEDYFEFSDDILIATTEKILFRDAGLFINSSTNGQLDIEADVELEITAPTVDINASTEVNISTTLTIGGELIQGSTATEHGAGAISTSFAPVTRRYTQNGVIITKIHFDLTGLKVKGDSTGDAIGLGAGGAAYIGRYVTSTYGVVYKAELACIELPAVASGTITALVDIGTNPTGTHEYDDGTSATVKLDNSGITAGQMMETLVPALTNNDYIYLVEGDTAATNGVYSAGQYILTFYGHAVTA
jgi:hypothetical protein